MDQAEQKKSAVAVNGGESGPGSRGASVNNNDQDIEGVPIFKRLKVVLPSMIVVIGIAVAAWYWYMGRRDYESTDDAFIDANRMSISSKILGRVDTLTVDEGDTINTGQLLVKLDDRDLISQQEQATASLTLAKENLKLAKVSVDKAQQDFDRAQAQIKDNVITAEQFDHAQKSLEEARAKYGIAQAQIGAADAQVNVITTQLKNTVITAPMRGVVSKRWILPGDVVQPGQPIYAIYDLDSVWTTANFEETKLALLHINDPVEISVDAYPNHPFAGRVAQIGTNTAAQFSLIPPNNASGNFTKVTQRVPVKILLEPQSAQNDPPNDMPLLPGMSVEVKVKVR